jgi:hypothetical protein
MRVATAARIARERLTALTIVAAIGVGPGAPVVAAQSGAPIGRPAGAERARANERLAADTARIPATLSATPATLTETRGSRRAPLWSPIASFALPGAGQLALRQPRAAAYLAVETYELLQLFEARRNKTRLRNEFHRTAREVARGPNFGGPLADGAWPYYEAMEEKIESGRFSLGTGGAIIPEPDEATFNGELWLKARSIYWDFPDVPPAPTDSAYLRAIAFYASQAVRDDFRWSWRNAEMMYNGYKGTIARYNASTRDARAAMGIIIANHLLSGIDAFASVRLRRASGADGVNRVDVTIPFERFGPRRRSRQ